MFVWLSSNSAKKILATWRHYYIYPIVHITQSCLFIDGYILYVYILRLIVFVPTADFRFWRNATYSFLIKSKNSSHWLGSHPSRDPILVKTLTLNEAISPNCGSWWRGSSIHVRSQALHLWQHSLIKHQEKYH